MLTAHMTVPPRHRHASHRKGHRRRSLIKLLALLLLTGSSTYAAYRMDIGGYFAVRQVEVGPTTLIPRAELERLCRELFLGRNLVLSLADSKSLLLEEPLVRQVRLTRRFPDQLAVTVEERRPVALLNAGQLLPVDQDGYILPLADSLLSPELPILTPRGPALEAFQVEGKRQSLDRESRRLLEAALALEHLAPELLPRLSEITIDDQGKLTVIALEDGIRVVMGRWIEERNIRYLGWMLDELAGHPDKPQSVDLSFEGQIIVRNGT